MKKILYCMHGTLGDVILNTSIVHEIKLRYPESEIYFATSKDYIDVLENNPDVKEVVALHPDPRFGIQEMILRAGVAYEQGFDKVYLPAQLTQEDSVWHQRPPYCTDGEFHNMVDFYASRCLDDIKITDRRTFIYPQDKHWDEIVNQIPEQFREKFKTDPYITFHTTSRLETKDWKYDKWVELVTRIKDKYPSLTIHQIGGPNDKAIPKPSIPLTGIPILNTAAIIKRSLLHIDIDSGTSFVSDSLNIPTICIMGSSSKINSGPIGRNVEFIEPVRGCIGVIRHCACVSNCNWQGGQCIDTVSVNEVFAEVTKKLDSILTKESNGVK